MDKDLKALKLELSKILEGISERQLQINMQSASARENLAEEIALRIKGKFYFTPFTSSFSESFLQK